MSTERQRDAETDRLLRAMLQPGVHHEACPDADVLAAYAERTLAAVERDRLETHFAECHRCQEALAFMARAWTAPEAAGESPRRAAWWSIPMRWLVPLATATVVVMYVAVRPVIAPYFQPTELSTDVAQAPAPEHVMADARPQDREPGIAPVAGRSGAGQFAPATAAKGEVTEQAQIARGQRPVARQTSVPEAPEKRTAKAADQARDAGKQVLESVALSPANPDLSRPSVPLPAIAESVSITEAKRPAGAAGMDRPVAPKQVQTAAAPPPPAPIVPPLSESVVVTAPRAGVAGAGGERSYALAASAGRAPRYVVSKDGASMWRIESAGRLSRSTDRGETWQPLSSGVSVMLLAGSSPSASVCWIVGANGTVILTTDSGARWTRSPFPEPVELIAVDATDARLAIVTARDGRRFATLDGGASWSQR